MSPLQEATKFINAIPEGYRALVNIGFPMIMALLLVGAFLAERYGWVEDVRTRQIEKLVESHGAIINAVAANQATLITNGNKIDEFGLKAEALSFAICRNTAEGVTEEDRCDRAMAVKPKPSSP